MKKPFTPYLPQNTPYKNATDSLIIENLIVITQLC